MLRFANDELELELDLRWAGLEASDKTASRVGKAAEDLRLLEAGAIANPSEQRRVGHYWLRSPAMAPDGLADVIRKDRIAVLEFAESIRQGGFFRDVLLLGIGGSALGPQFLHDALDRQEGLRFFSIDNTDPAGAHRTLRMVELDRTLVLVVSKSGGTAETRNALRLTQGFFQEHGVDFASHAVAITMQGSALDEEARAGGWLQRFPQWDWVGGRTSISSSVGMLPAVLMGIDTKAFLEGCAQMDAWCREENWNPATALATVWYRQAMEHNRKTLVFLPYSDRLLLMGRYFQQLIMESIGKPVNGNGWGLSVLGNKGSTDQHALVQQLREGSNDFFASFVAVLDKTDDHQRVQGHRSAGDYLIGLLLGTRRALTQAGRCSYTLVVPRVDERRLGAIVALHERAVGAYASMLGINAYDQPGVEAGKRCAEEFLIQQDQARSGTPLPETGEYDLLRAWMKAD